MRIWDIHTKHLCRKHLLGEHRELHGLWNIITKYGGKGGYSQHPETKRWIGKAGALRKRHEDLVREMEKRGYRHNSLLEKKLAKGKQTQNIFIHTPKEQKEILRNKNCECFNLIEKQKTKQFNDIS